MKRPLRDSVVVITGASSGIGRASALAFSREGAHVVVAARRSGALEELADECRRLGGRAIAVPTDVRDPEAVESLAARTYDEFGRIDTWVNNAAVSLFARFDETPPTLFREVIETNFFGCVYGARSALRRFREQGAGVLINVSSVVGEIGQPYTSAYVSSKWAIRGFSETLRLELSLDEAPDIRVCTVLPAAIDTPLFQQAANYAGRGIQPLKPTYDARIVARTIVGVARKPKPEVHAGGIGRLAWLQRALPQAFDRLYARMIERDHFQDAPAERSDGNVREPIASWTTIDGEWRETDGRNGRLPNAALWAGPALLAGAALVGWRARSAATKRGRLARLRR